MVKTLRPLTKMFFDAHLMCSKPEILIKPFHEAGVDQITIHVELGEQVVTQLIWKIKSLGLKAGLAVNPPTSVNLLQPHLEQIDLLLVMTVNPGFGGQPFIHETLPKIQQAAEWRRSRRLGYRIQVDGGINNATAAECARAGADSFVSGTALLSKRGLAQAVKKMRAITLKAHPTHLPAHGVIPELNLV